MFASVVLLVSLFCFAPLLAQSARFQPVVGDSFFIDLASGDNINQNTPGTAATIYDVNLFITSAATIASLHAKGIKVVCWFPAGAVKPSDSDFASFPAIDLGNNVTGIPGARYLDVRDVNIYPLITARIDNATAKGCDGVDLGYDATYGNATSGTNTGFGLTVSDSVTFFQNMAVYAHGKNLSIGLRDGRLMVPFVENLFADFAIVENCFYDDSLLLTGAECKQFMPFVDDNKPVFPIEYFLQPSQWCKKSNKFRFFGGFYPVSLNGSFIWCSNIATLASTLTASGPAGSIAQSPAAPSSIAQSPAAPSSSASLVGTPSTPASQAASPSIAASIAASVSNVASLAPSVSIAASVSNVATASPSLLASQAASAANSPSVGTSLGASVAASVAAQGSLTNTCITCLNPTCGKTTQFRLKCTGALHGIFSHPTPNTLCCNAPTSVSFKYSWHVKATSCAGPFPVRKLGQLCTALSGTVTCAPDTTKVGKVKLTCSKP